MENPEQGFEEPANVSRVETEAAAANERVARDYRSAMQFGRTDVMGFGYK